MASCFTLTTTIMEGDPLSDSAMRERVARFLASGEDPNGYYVSSETLLRTIGEVKNVAEETRARVSAAVQDLILPGNFVDSFRLGMMFGQLLMNETSDIEGITAIGREMKNLNNVPYVSIRGKAVN